MKPIDETFQRIFQKYYTPLTKVDGSCVYVDNDSSVDMTVILVHPLTSFSPVEVSGEGVSLLRGRFKSGDGGNKLASRSQSLTTNKAQRPSDN